MTRDRSEVTAVVEDYGDALREGRTEEICTELFAAEYAQQAEPAGGCERFIKEGTPNAKDFELNVEAVTVDGDAASVRFTASGKVGGAQVPPGVTATARLVRHDDGWRIAALGGS